MNTLYISDLDGTLLNAQAKLKNRAKDILNRLIENNIDFTIATARSWASAKPILKGLNLQLPVVCMNGVMIVDPKTDEIIKLNSFSEEQIQYAKSTFESLGESVMVYSIIENEHRISWLKGKETKGIKFYISNRVGDKRLRPCENIEQLWKGEIYYFNVLDPKNKEMLDNFFNDKGHFSVNFQPDSYDINHFWYEIFDKDCDKGKSCLFVKKIIGAEKIISFGDNVNDMTMLEMCDEFYAVSNAMGELKEKATGIIGSNLEDGVPVFIDNHNTILRNYSERKTSVDKDKFNKALEKAILSQKTTIGTQNEKLIHSSLKNYFSENQDDHEIKIGKYYADIVGENGIIEIQTTAFQKLNEKLSDFLKASHVTIVYPFAYQTAFKIIDKNTGEILKEGDFRKNYQAKSYGDFFRELYRIKGFLMNKNLSICVALLKIDETRYERKSRRGGKRYTKIKAPVELLDLDFFEKPDDYKKFIPEQILKKGEVSRGEFIKAVGLNGSIMLEILNYLGIMSFSRKEGRKYYYKVN